MTTIIRLLEHINVGMGVILNAILIYLIRRYSRVEMGMYKYLLAGFSAYDLYLAVLHGIVNPKTIRVNSTYGTVAHSFIESANLLAAYYSFYTISFALLNIHFLYRYWVVRHPTWVSLFSKPSFILLIIVYLITQFVAWNFIAMSIDTDPRDPALPILRKAFRAIYNDTVTHGWLVMDHWRNGQFNYSTLFFLVPSSTIMAATFANATYLAWGTYRGIAKTESISQAHRSFQIKILVAVCAQTFVPFLFVYLPYICVLNFPILGVPDFGISLAFPALVSLFPAWDAIVLTAFIKDYREGALRLFRLRTTPEFSTVPMTASSDLTTRWAETIVK